MVAPMDKLIIIRASCNRKYIYVLLCCLLQVKEHVIGIPDIIEWLTDKEVAFNDVWGKLNLIYSFDVTYRDIIFRNKKV